MNLADYEKLEEKNSGGEFIKFQNNGETRFLRFMYTSGGDKMGEDVEFRKRKWDDEERKYVYDTDDGTLMTSLKCIEYDADGKNPRLVKWDRSAYFCKNVLLPQWRNFPRICDGVWKVTATNPTDKSASYSLFPVMSADTIKFPIIEASSAPKAEPAPAKTTEEPKPKKKYWED